MSLCDFVDVHTRCACMIMTILCYFRVGRRITREFFVRKQDDVHYAIEAQNCSYQHACLVYDNLYFQLNSQLHAPLWNSDCLVHCSTCSKCCRLRMSIN